jgi:hypothetical protein
LIFGYVCLFKLSSFEIEVMVDFGIM